jgi:hypothetical protein
MILQERGLWDDGLLLLRCYMAGCICGASQESYLHRNEEELGKIEVTKNDESECYLVTQTILTHSAIYLIQHPVANFPY